MRKFSVKPTLTLKGRTFKGLPGWSGKPLHPPLTDIPIGAYVIVAALDLLSAIGGDDHTWAKELWHAATFVMVGGRGVTAHGVDWSVGYQGVVRGGHAARRTINTHTTITITATVLALVTVIWRLSVYGDELSTPVGILVLSLLVAGLVATGATFGGTLVYDYGFNVETAGDSPVWHKSEIDVMPGDKKS